MLPKITIIAIGKLKENHFQIAFDEYLKRLKPYLKVEVVELKAESFSTDNKTQAIKKEGERLIKYLDSFSGIKIILDEKGKQFTSLELTKKLNQFNQELILVIGGSLGLAQEVKNKADLLWSLSKLTLPHELARVVMIEQLYRTITINLGKVYHY